MALGGFSGGDQILSADELRKLVADGEVRFFLLAGGGNQQQGLTRWVAERCEAVPQEVWGTAPSGPARLFDCRAFAGHEGV